MAQNNDITISGYFKKVHINQLILLITLAWDKINQELGRKCFDKISEKLEEYFQDLVID